ncbi:D-amino acid dehydrogenase [Martelella mangrovi]|uniref:D-amino-acid dehydrogenase n=1 Tax=Martelella mangrovi TaxID=1397477 RepID=A0ABV2IE43_9HYPH
MKVIVIGAGVVGIATAWYLTAEGYEVTVVDRCAGPAGEASFGNAGGICPSFAGPWAAPGMPFKAMKWMFKAFPPLKIRPQADPAQWLWLMRFAANCTAERFAENKQRMQRIAHYSRRCLDALRAETGISFDFAEKGTLQVFTTEAEAEGGRRSARVLSGLGINHRFIEGEEIYQVEPALRRARARFLAALHLPDDATGDSHMFCHALAGLLKERGCRFVFDADVRGFDRDGDRIAAIVTPDGKLTADAYVVAAGAFAPALVRPLGIALPVYPVKGYSITCPIDNDDEAPLSSVMDEHSKIMINRLGGRLRAAGVAELAGYDRRLSDAARRGISASVEKLFPGACDYTKVQFWSGFRPMTPDGPAIVGKTGLTNLYLNTGHGSNGWTQSCGTGKIIADIVSGRAPEVAP